MNTNKSKRFPNLGNLSIAILEHSLESILGKDAIKEIKSPVVEKELRTQIISALQNAEKRFINEHPDCDLSQIFVTFPAYDLPGIQQAVYKFYNQPTSTEFENTLRDLLQRDCPKLSKRRIEFAVENYLRILREEISIVAPLFREKLIALSTLRTEQRITQLAETSTQKLQLLVDSGLHPARTHHDIERQVIRNLFVYLEDRRAIWAPVTILPRKAELSVDEVRDELTKAIQKLPDTSKAIEPLRKMRGACRDFLDAIETNYGWETFEGERHLLYEIFAQEVAAMAAEFDVTLSSELDEFVHSGYPPP
jgi:hypothetical protein